MKENHRAHLFCVPLKLLPRRFINSQIGVHKEGYKKECEENRQKHHMFSHRINEIRPRQMYGSLVTSGDSSANQPQANNDQDRHEDIDRVVEAALRVIDTLDPHFYN